MHSAEGSIVEQFAANIILLIVNVPIDCLSSRLRMKLYNILMEKNSLNYSKLEEEFQPDYEVENKEDIPSTIVY